MSRTKLTAIWLAASVFLVLVYSLLIVHTSPKIEFDAGIFWKYSQVFIQHGLWQGLRFYAPPREPGYPLFLYFIQRVVGESSTPHTTVALQFLLLLATTLMAAGLTYRFKKRPFLSLFILLIVGLSPALLNAAMSLYAESLSAFLFTGWVAAFFFAATVERTTIRWLSLLTSALCGDLLILTRGAYLHIAFLSFVGWTLLVWYHASSRRMWVMSMLLYSLVMLAGPLGWMARNKHVAGLFNMADHSAIVLSGRYKKSLERYTWRDIAAGSLNAASESACQSFFGDCSRYSWAHANALGYDAANILQGRTGLDSGHTMQKLFRDTVHSILWEHPIRFFLFGWFEWIQLVFFETVSTGAVQMNHPLLHLLESNRPFRGFVHIGLSIFYLVGFCFLLKEVQFETLLLVTPIAAHFFIYGMATSVLRYSFVIAPIYIALALMGWGTLWSRKQIRAQ